MNKHTTKLIHGIFEKDKAKILLLELLWHKINFHTMQQFSNEERFGRDDEHYDKRIRELVNAKSDLCQWLDLLHEDCKISINCDIEMQVDDILYGNLMS